MVLEADSAHLRADAKRNLERILEAAHAVFAEHGLEASVADVAERAGVGTATIFRRFPTKEDLVAASIEQQLRASLELLRSNATLETVMTETIGQFVADRCLCEAVSSQVWERPQIVALAEAITQEVEAVLKRAQRDGQIRKDVVASDIGFLIHAVGQASLRLERTAPGAWQRYAEIVLDGLRPEGARRLKHKPPTFEQLHEAKKM